MKTEVEQRLGETVKGICLAKALSLIPRGAGERVGTCCMLG